MRAINYDDVIEQGATFVRQLEFFTPEGEVFDITGCTFSGMIRKSIDDPEPTATFTAGIFGNPTDGICEYSLTSEETGGITVTANPLPVRKYTPYLYDLDMTMPNGDVIRLLEGTMNVSPSVTK